MAYTWVERATAADSGGRYVVLHAVIACMSGCPMVCMCAHDRCPFAHESTHAHDPYSAPGTHNPNTAPLLDDALQEKGSTRNNLKPDRVEYQASLETAFVRQLSDVVLGQK